MKRFGLMVITIISFASTSLAREIKKDSPDYSDIRSWKVGDDVESIGKVVKKETAGDKVKVTLDLNGIRSYLETNLK